MRQRGVIVVRYPIAGDRSIDGSYRLAGGQAFVYVNSSRSRAAVRQRFTAAHELGHHEIDLPADRTNIVDDDVYRIYGPHREMNEFAAAFLIDPVGARELERDGLTGDRLVAATISKFSVSFKAAAIELKHLDLISKGDCEDLMARRDEEDFRVGEFVEGYGFAMPEGAWDRELDPSYLELVKRRYERGSLNVTAVAAALRVGESEAQAWLDESGACSPAVRGDEGLFLPN